MNTNTLKPYHVDLTSLMQLYETNYIKLNRLLPSDPKVEEKHDFQVMNATYQLKVLELTRYTTLVTVNQCDRDPNFTFPSMKIRLYHDAKMAEVCASEQFFYINPVYDYPNKKMMQKDEKHQVNKFLSDWLTFCLKYGIAV